MPRIRPQTSPKLALALSLGALLATSSIASAQEAPPAGSVPGPVAGSTGNTTQDVLRQAETGSFRRSVEDLIDRIRGQVRNAAPGGVVTPAEAQAPAAGTIALPAPTASAPTGGTATVVALPAPAPGGVALPPPSPTSGTVVVSASAPAAVAVGRPGTVAIAAPRVAQSAGVVVGKAAPAEAGAIQVTSGPATKVVGAVRVSAEKPVVAIQRIGYRSEPRRYGFAAWCW